MGLWGSPLTVGDRDRPLRFDELAQNELGRGGVRGRGQRWLTAATGLCTFDKRGI
jgi:hypothetical protein